MMPRKAETDGGRMGRKGAIWLAKVSAATALLAVIGIFAAPADGNLAPGEPPAQVRHFSVHG